MGQIRTGAVPGRLLKSQPWDDLVPHLLKVGADIPSVTERLKQFAHMLLEWNRGASNLISRRDEPRLVSRHLMESIEPAHWLKESGATRWIDFGSGGGLPAMPLALLGIGERWTLVESRRSKTLFLRKTIQDMSLTNIEIVHDRLENLIDADDRAGSFEGFTSRATTTIGPTLRLAARFVSTGGKAFLWKGSGREVEMKADPAWRDDWELDGLLGIGSGQTVVTRFIRK